jgi:hypothetical protein
MSIIYPRASILPGKVRAFIDFMTAEFSGKDLELKQLALRHCREWKLPALQSDALGRRLLLAAPGADTATAPSRLRCEAEKARGRHLGLPTSGGQCEVTNSESNGRG